jgi:hypothetical protein
MKSMPSMASVMPCLAYLAIWHEEHAQYGQCDTRLSLPCHLTWRACRVWPVWCHALLTLPFDMKSMPSMASVMPCLAYLAIWHEEHAEYGQCDAMLCLPCHLTWRACLVWPVWCHALLTLPFDMKSMPSMASVMPCFAYLAIWHEEHAEYGQCDAMLCLPCHLTWRACRV